MCVFALNHWEAIESLRKRVRDSIFIGSYLVRNVLCMYIERNCCGKFIFFNYVQSIDFLLARKKFV